MYLCCDVNFRHDVVLHLLSAMMKWEQIHWTTMALVIKQATWFHHHHYFSQNRPLLDIDRQVSPPRPVLIFSHPVGYCQIFLHTISWHEMSDRFYFFSIRCLLFCQNRGCVTCAFHSVRLWFVKMTGISYIWRFTNTFQQTKSQNLAKKHIQSILKSFRINDISFNWQGYD